MKGFILFMGMLMFTSCREDKSSVVASEEEDVPDSGEDNWWEEDVDSEPSDEQEEEEDKEDEDKEDEGEKDGWTAILDSSTGLGDFYFNVLLTDGTECVASLPVEEAVPTEDCTDCLFAWDLTMGVLTIDAESMSGCAEFAEWEGLTVSYGQSSNFITEYEGISYYELSFYDEDSASWSIFVGGYSSESASGEWVFGAK